MEMNPADMTISRNGENFRIWDMRRRRPAIGARKYALKERYSPRRKVPARRLRSARQGGAYALCIAGGMGGNYADRPSTARRLN